MRHEYLASLEPRQFGHPGLSLDSLRLHRCLRRRPISSFGCFCRLFQVSKAAADLMAYCEAHAKEDPLLTPVPASENPFREKKFFCAIL